VEPACPIRQALRALVAWPAGRKDNAMKFRTKKIQMRKVLVIAALGAAGSFGVAACATAGPAVLQSRPPTTSLLPATGPTDNSGVAREIARIAVGHGGLTALNSGDGQAALATCDPGTLSNRPDVSTPASASCGISYADGSVWRQTVTVTFGSNGNPVAAWTNLGTELLLPTGG
jgi:hypothetical protein